MFMARLSYWMGGHGRNREGMPGLPPPPGSASGLTQLLHDELHWLDVPRRVQYKVACSSGAPVSAEQRTEMPGRLLHSGLRRRQSIAHTFSQWTLPDCTAVPRLTSLSVEHVYGCDYVLEFLDPESGSQKATVVVLVLVLLVIRSLTRSSATA